MATPFGNVAFDPERRGSDAIANSAIVETPSNGERAADGCLALALFCALDPEVGPERAVLEEIASLINLTEAPEDALADLLANLMHYCHREGIEWFGEDGVSQVALRNFSAESGGCRPMRATKSVQCPSDGKQCAFATCVRERLCYLTKKRLQPAPIPYDPHKRRPSEHGVGGRVP